jgi:ABC-type nitrate/sulfonate/bicarbonate transport system substrate-binding protein
MKETVITMRYKRITAALLLLSVLLAGCAKKSAAVDEVTLVLDWLPNTNHTGFYVALEKGYYAEEGLSVSIEQPPEDGVLPLLASGRADFGITAQESITAAITADSPLPVVAVSALIQHNTSGIISLKEKGITGPKDMENHNYATWDTPIEKAILKRCIENEGGDYDKIEMIPNTVTDVLAALQTNIDTVWIFYGWDGIAAEVKGLDTNYFYFSDFAPELDFYTPVLASSPSYLSANGDTAKKFLKASARGFEYAIEHPEEAAEILCKAAPETDPEIAKASQLYLADQYKAEVDRWGYIDPARWNAFSAWLYDNGVITKALDPGQGFTNDYLAK